MTGHLAAHIQDTQIQDSAQSIVGYLYCFAGTFFRAIKF